MVAPHKGEGEDWGELPQFRTLRRLITILTATLIIGIMTIAAVLIWRIASEPAKSPVAAITAEEIVLPSDAEVLAVGATASALTVAISEGGAESLLVFHPVTGELIQRVKINRAFAD